MLHTVKYIVEMGLTQKMARAEMKAAIDFVTMKAGTYAPITKGLGEAVARDAGGTFQDFEVEGRTMGQLVHNMTGKDKANLKADMRDFFESEEFKALPVRAEKVKTERVLVKADEAYAKLTGMSVSDFGKYAEDHGIKATIDRGVWSLNLPGVRGTVYFDSQTGEQLAVGESAADRKITLDGRKAEGKIKSLAFMVAHKRAKLTKKQEEFLFDCSEAGLTIPDVLMKAVTGG